MVFLTLDGRGQERGLVVGDQLQPCVGLRLDPGLPVQPGQPQLHDHQLQARIPWQ